MPFKRIADVKFNELVFRYLKHTDKAQYSQGSRLISDADRITPSVPDVLSDPVEWPSNWRDLFEERAAIREYEGNLKRAEAERSALEDVKRHFH